MQITLKFSKNFLNFILLGLTIFLISAKFDSCGLPLEGGIPMQPNQPAYGPGGADYRHADVIQNFYGQGETAYWIFEPASPTPASAPLIVFGHGWLGWPWSYGDWIEHLVRRGNIVVYPMYQDSIRTPAEVMTPNAIKAIKDAIQRLQSGGHVLPQLDYFALVGHSAGATICANIAASAVSEGLPQPKALMVVHPGSPEYSPRVSRGTSLLGDYSAIPATILFLVVVSEEDNPGPREVVPKILFDGTPQIPLANKDFITALSDYHGVPPLVSDHYSANAPNDEYDAGDVPLEVKREIGEKLGLVQPGEDAETDALDYYGYWKLFDGLTDAAFYGKNREYALGNTPEQVFMGEWSDGIPVNKLVVTKNP